MLSLNLNWRVLRVDGSGVRARLGCREGALASSMDELERTAVQLWEAKRLAEYEDVVHGRLALLLLDNAAETCLMRSSQSFLTWAEMYGNMAYQLRDVDPDDVEGQRLKGEIEAKTLSRRRRRQIERNFSDLVDYVFAQDGFGLQSEFADCLKILHRYRNAAYYRDTVRPDVLGPAVQIYFFLCCQLLKHERQIFSQIDQIPTAVEEIFGDQMPASEWPSGAADSASLGSELADFFLSVRGLDHAGIASALSAHLLGRLATLDRDLTTIGESVLLGIKRWAVLQNTMSERRRREDRVEETRTQLTDLQDRITRWFKARRMQDRQRQYWTQLGALESVLQPRIHEVRNEVDAIPDLTHTGDVYAACRLNDRRIQLLDRYWRYFGDKCDQRDKAALGDTLQAADEIVWSCWFTPFTLAGESVAAAPLPYLEPFHTRGPYRAPRHPPTSAEPTSCSAPHWKCCLSR